MNTVASLVVVLTLAVGNDAVQTLPPDALGDPPALGSSLETTGPNLSASTTRQRSDQLRQSVKLENDKIAKAIAGQPCDPFDGGPLGRFNSGDLGARECALQRIRDAGQLRDLYDPSDSFQPQVEPRPSRVVGEQVDLLRGFYVQRARRQQLITDAQAGLVVFGALGALASTGAGANTQRVWAYTTFAPVVNGQINANEPTRNLYHGGALALGLIGSRYRKIEELERLIEAFPSVKPDDGCSENTRGRLTDQVSSIRAWVTDPAVASSNAQPSVALTASQSAELTIRRDDRAALLPEAERLSSACDAVRSGYRERESFKTALGASKANRAAAYAEDALILDQALLARDRNLRYTPAETVGAIIVSPLRTLDSILTGQSAQNAINILKTDAAFTGLNQTLSRVRVPSAPSSLPLLTDLPATIPARSAIIREGAHGATFSEAMAILTSSRAELAVAMREWNFQAALLRELVDAIRADELIFNYDITTSTVDVALLVERPATQPPATPVPPEVAQLNPGPPAQK